MPVAETLQPEAGDDRNKDVEIAKLYEMYDAPSAPDRLRPGPGDIVLRPVGQFGGLALRRSNGTVDYRNIA